MRSQEDLFEGGVPGLHKARTVEEVLKRSGGDEIISWLRALGFWTEERPGRRAVEVPKEYSSLNDASGEKLSDMLAAWSSEYARASEILGVLQGERVRLKLALDRVEAEVSIRVLNARKQAEEKAPTQKQLAMEVSTDAGVREAEDRLALIDQAIKAVSGVKEAAQGVRDGISREITRRGDLIKGRLAS